MAKKTKDEKIGFIKYLKMAVQGNIFSPDFFRAPWGIIASVGFFFCLSLANRYVCPSKLVPLKELRFVHTTSPPQRGRAAARYMGLVRHSRIVTLVNENRLGLEIPDTPPVKLGPTDVDKE